MATSIVPIHDPSDLLPTVSDTLTTVLEDPTINRTFGGRDGKLSAAQAGLASAVTVKMQDRLLEHAQMSHQREMRLLGGLWKLYKTPVLSFSVDHSATSSDARSSPASAPKPKGLLDYITWGNLLGGAALTITAVALWYTSVSSNYKSNWERAEVEKKAIQEQLTSAQKAAEDQAAEWGKAVARAEALDDANKQLTLNQKDMGVELRKLIEANGRAKGELARQTALASGERTYERLYSKVNQELEKLRRENAELQKRVTTAP